MWMWIRNAVNRDRREGVELQSHTVREEFASATRGNTSLTSALDGQPRPPATSIDLPIATPGVILCVASQTMYMNKASKMAATTAAGMFLSRLGTERPLLIASSKIRTGAGRVCSRGRRFAVLSGEGTTVSSPSETASVLAVAGVLLERETVGATRRVSAAGSTFSAGFDRLVFSSLPSSMSRTRVFASESGVVLPACSCASAGLFGTASF